MNNKELIVKLIKNVESIIKDEEYIKLNTTEQGYVNIHFENLVYLKRILKNLNTLLNAISYFEEKDE